jgi:hypothetical protein
MSDTSRRSQTALRQAVHYRNYRRVRDRALRRLAHQYPDQYRLFLEEERAKDEADGKSWLDISGRTKRSMGSAGAPNGDSTVSESHQDGDDPEEGNLG